MQDGWYGVTVHGQECALAAHSVRTRCRSKGRLLRSKIRNASTNRCYERHLGYSSQVSLIKTNR